MKRVQPKATTRARRPKLKTAAAKVRSIPKRYKPPSKLPPGTAPEVEGEVEQHRPGRYSRARGIAVKKLEPQTETTADYGDDK
jgi:hypothetical protein